MDITKETFPDIQEEEKFCKFFGDFSIKSLNEARLYPRISKPRLIEAHGAWQNDLSRVGEHERLLDDGLDHFKRAGHLSFWLRRMSPVVEVADLTQNIGDAEGHPLSDDEEAFRELLFAYCNEYLAFDIGFQLCKHYEANKIDGASDRAKNLILSEEYYQSMCQFLKYKTVSPHALFLVFKSLFFDN